MMTDIDLSPEALFARRALAEKATRGEWITTGINSVHGGYRNRLIYPDKNPHFLIASMSTTNNPKCVEDADHIAANSPDVVMADIDEILRLREQVATQEVLSGEDDACMTQLEVERDALEEQVARLEKEADWLAQCAANDGWHGVRVSREFMREQARKAVEGAA